MAKEIVSDELWNLVEPLLPLQPPRWKGGRPRVSDRAVLTGVVFVLMTGIPWEKLPPEMGCGSGMTCWRRLRDWQKAGVWEELHAVMLDRLAASNRIDWERARCGLGFGACAAGEEKGGAENAVGPSPVNRGKLGTKRHLIVDGHGKPLGAVLSGANVNDNKMLAAVIDTIPEVRPGRPGRPRFRPKKVYARQGLRLARVPQGAQQPRHRSSHCEARHRKQ